MEVGDLIRDWLRGYIGLFLELDDGGYFAKILWLGILENFQALPVSRGRLFSGWVPFV